jgi:hypothetical protein
MKKFLVPFALLVSFSAFSQVQIDNLTKDDVKDVTAEFGGNFAHTAVAAPETDGAWGVEVGLVGGKTKSPNFSDVVDAAGGKGDDFKSIYHAGIMGRVHFPMDFFAEFTTLPEQEFDDVKIKSTTFGVGWNVGGFLNLPLDVAIGLDQGRGEVKFHQDQDGSTPEADIKFKTKTTVYWVGVSKSFWIVTPYAKIGSARIEGDLDATASIFTYTGKQSESVTLTGGYYAVGANFQLAFIKLGIEGSQVQDTRRFSGKLSFDF